MYMDKKESQSLLWVGISLQKGSNVALDEKFASGKLIKKLTDKLPNFIHHKTNLVDFAPLDQNDKLRYPTKDEIKDSFSCLMKQIEVIRPRIIVALGGAVTKSLSDMMEVDIEFPKTFDYKVNEGEWPVMSIHHPSYISIYKRKKMDDYVNGVVNGVNESVKK